MESRNFSTSYNLLAKSFNQVVYFLTNCFTFLIKFCMLKVRKSRFCEMFANFFQCRFMNETQVSMTVSNFLGLFSRYHFLEGDFTFQWGVGAPWEGHQL